MITPLSNRSVDPRFRPAPGEDVILREAHPAGNGVRFVVVGNLSEHKARLFRLRVIDELLDGQRAFLIDLAHAQTLESGALGILVSITRRVRESQGEIEFENVSEQVRTLFEMMRLDQVFVIREPKRTNAARRTPSSSSVIPLNGRRKTP